MQNNKVKKIYRFGIRYFKQNQQIKNNKGFFVYRLNENNQFKVNIIGINENNQPQSENFVELYDKYSKYITDDDSSVILVQYFNIDNNKGEQAEDVVQIAQQQLVKIFNNDIKKPNDKNVEKLTCKI